MTETVVLRFRDLVTPVGGTIAEHQALVDRRKSVWWGWWKRQTELCPTAFLGELHTRARAVGSGVAAYVFDAGTGSLYRTHLLRIAVAPIGGTVCTPDPTRTPSYYQLAEYAGWFQLTGFEQVVLSKADLSYHSYPTHELLSGELGDRIGKPFCDAEDIRSVDATLYGVTYKNAGPKSG